MRPLGPPGRPSRLSTPQHFAVDREGRVYDTARDINVSIWLGWAMADRARISRLIADIAGRPRAVTFDEVHRIVNQIKLLDEVVVRERPTTHGYQFTIGTRIIRVKKPPRGHMKEPYVTDFIGAMVDLGFYEE